MGDVPGCPEEHQHMTVFEWVPSRFSLSLVPGTFTKMSWEKWPRQISLMSLGKTRLQRWAISPPTYTKEQKHCFQVDLQWWRRTLHTDHSTTLELSGAGWCKCECSGDWNGGCGGKSKAYLQIDPTDKTIKIQKIFLNIFSIESSKICCSIALYMIENVIKKNTEGVQ